MYQHLYTRAHMYWYLQVYVHTFTGTYRFMCTHVLVPAGLCAHMYWSLQVYVHTCTGTYRFICTIVLAHSFFGTIAKYKTLRTEFDADWYLWGDKGTVTAFTQGTTYSYVVRWSYTKVSPCSILLCAKFRSYQKGLISSIMLKCV